MPDRSARPIAVSPVRALLPAIAVLSVMALLALMTATANASAQQPPDPDVGTLFLNVYIDPEGDGYVPGFVIASPCLAADSTIAPVADARTDPNANANAGSFVSRVFDEIVDAQGEFCEYTVTPTPDGRVEQVYPAAATFRFSNGPYAEANASFSVLRPETNGTVRVGMSGWPITIEEYEARDWPSPSTWTFEGFPEAWSYEVTSGCLDDPQILTVEAITELSPTYGSEGTLGGLPLFADDGTECMYNTEPMLEPGFVVASRTGRFGPHSLLPEIVAGPSFLIVRGEIPVLCDGHVVTVDLASGDAPTNGDDVILGTNGDDVIMAGDGDDIICGLGGEDLIRGQAGDDVIYGDQGGDFIRGGPGNDEIFGGAGADDLSGSTGDDRVWAQGGDDIAVRGGTGDDYVNGGAGDDVLVAGNGGEDTVDGSLGNDKVTGGPRPDEVIGGAGDDEVKGNKGADMLFGGPDNDSLFGGPQPDSLDGGDGTDSCNGGTEVDTETDCEVLTAIP